MTECGKEYLSYLHILIKTIVFLMKEQQLQNFKIKSHNSKEKLLLKVYIYWTHTIAFTLPSETVFTGGNV